MKELNIENCPDNHYYVEFLVFKNFIAALKRHGMYSNFRCLVGINTNNCVSTMYRKMNCFGNIIQRQSKENIFRDARNIGDFLRMMSDSFGGKRGSDFANRQDGSLQHHIANCTNMLLHVFVERYNNDFGLLSEIGGEIFNATCTEIFGENFVDETQPSPEQCEQLRKIHELASRGKIPQLSPKMMEQLKQIIDNNHDIYNSPTAAPLEEPGWLYDDEDYEYNDDEYYDEFFEEPEEEQVEQQQEAPDFPF